MQFTEGQVVEGMLISYSRVMISDPNDSKAPAKPVVSLLIREEDGNRLKIHATRNILDKLDQGDVGKFVSIRYEGEDHSVRRNGNSMRRFKVFVADDEPGDPKVPQRKNVAPDGTEITDDDIPF